MASIDVRGTGGAAAADTAAIAFSTDATAPTGALGQTYPRLGFGSNVDAAATLRSGTMYMTAIVLRAGSTITNIVCNSGVTAAASPTAWWFALYNGTVSATAPTLMTQTADQTSTAWAARTSKSVALSSAQSVTTSGLYFVAVCMVAGTTVNLTGYNSNRTELVNISPPLCGDSTGSLTTTAPATAGAISFLNSVGNQVPYIYVT